MTRLTPEQIAEIKAHEAQTEREIQHNFGAAYSSRIEDAYQIHLDRKRLLSHIEADGWNFDMAQMPEAETYVYLLSNTGTVFPASWQCRHNAWLADCKAWMPCPLPAPPETKEG